MAGGSGIEVILAPAGSLEPIDSIWIDDKDHRAMSAYSQWLAILEIEGNNLTVVRRGIDAELPEGPLLQHAHHGQARARCSAELFVQ